MIQLGDKVRDEVTGFEGYATARLERIEMDTTIEVTGNSVNNAVPPVFWLAESRLDVISKGNTE